MYVTGSSRGTGNNTPSQCHRFTQRIGLCSKAKNTVFQSLVFYMLTAIIFLVVYVVMKIFGALSNIVEETSATSRFQCFKSKKRNFSIFLRHFFFSKKY